MGSVTDEAFDLRYDPDEVGGDLVVECWISQGPRAEEPGFDPQPADMVTLGDDDEPPSEAESSGGTATGFGSKSCCPRTPTPSPEPHLRPTAGTQFVLAEVATARIGAAEPR